MFLSWKNVFKLESSIKFIVKLKLKDKISKLSQACGSPSRLHHVLYSGVSSSPLPPWDFSSRSSAVSPVRSLRGLLHWDHGTD